MAVILVEVVSVPAMVDVNSAVHYLRTDICALGIG